MSDNFSVKCYINQLALSDSAGCHFYSPDLYFSPVKFILNRDGVTGSGKGRRGMNPDITLLVTVISPWHSGIFLPQLTESSRSAAGSQGRQGQWA